MSNNPLRQIYSAAREVLKQPSLRGWFVVAALAIFLAYILLPVWLTPGNSVAFQLSLLRIKDYALFLVLSAVTALLVVMQMYVVKRAGQRKQQLMAVGSGGVGIYSAVVGGLLATAACASCVAVLLGFLGAGSVLFILTYRWYVIVAAITLVVIALYFTARRVNGLCEDCEVPGNDK